MPGQSCVSQGRPTRAFFARPVLEVAPEPLGCTISHAGVTVRLTEVEAYDGLNDPGSHAFRGPTPRTRVMFGEPGGLDVYFTYGMHWCANLVCGSVGVANGTVSLLLLGVLLGGVTMTIGMLVHEVSVLVVIVNAMRLLRRMHDHNTLATPSRAPTRIPAVAQHV